jgi:hypothetical protein
VIGNGKTIICALQRRIIKGRNKQEQNAISRYGEIIGS